MKNTQLKFLANLAKQRLMNQDYSEPKAKSRNTASNYFIQNALAIRKLKAETNYVTIKEEEDIEFINKVKDLLQDDCYNPLGKLCDYEYFCGLNQFEKEFYILNLREKYNRVKDQVLCG